MEIGGLAAIVTGGGSALGAAAAEALAHCGAKVTIFDTNAALGCQKAEGIGGRAVAVDVTDKSSVDRAVAEAEKFHGKARILVNCVGVGGHLDQLDHNTPIDLNKVRNRMINKNFIGSLNTISCFASRLHGCDTINSFGEIGVVINTISVRSIENVGNPLTEAATRGTAIMALPIARELLKQGIRLNAVAPGPFWTRPLDAMITSIRKDVGIDVPIFSRFDTFSKFSEKIKWIINNNSISGEIFEL